MTVLKDNWPSAPKLMMTSETADSYPVSSRDPGPGVKLRILFGVNRSVLLLICSLFFCLSFFFAEIKAEKRKKSEEIDPMDPASYSDAPK